MKKLFLIFILFISISCAALIDKDAYTVNYKFINYAQAPNKGTHSYKIFISNNQVIKTIDLNKGTEISPNKAYGINDIINSLNGYTNGLKIKYKNGLPFRIKPNNNYYIIYINSINNYNNGNTNLVYIKLKQLKKYYTIWRKLKLNSYRLHIQDSRIINSHKEGIEILVKNNKIVEILDVRTYQKISINNKYLFTVEKLFGIARWDIKNATIIYDDNYGYPTSIKLRNGISIIAYLYKL